MATVDTNTSTNSSYDYSSINAFSSSEATKALSGDLIDKLRKAEEKAVLDPIIQDLEDIEIETDTMNQLKTLINDFETLTKGVDLYSQNNIFEQFSASASGDSALFDAVDTSKLNEGVINVSISQLAQRDVYQTNTFSDPDALIDGGGDEGDKITIKIDLNGDGDTDDDGESVDFGTTGKTYKELANNINNNSNFIATVEQVGDSDYRIIIKSANTGTANALTITQTGTDLGLENDDNHILSAQNLKAKVDGIDYNISSNTIAMNNGLTITAVDTGDSSVSIQKNTAGITPQLQAIAEQYNAIVGFIDENIYNEEAKIENPGALRDLKDGIKNIFFGKYGSDGNDNIFNYGFSFDKTGHLSVDTAKLGKAINENYEGLKELFLGTAEKEGLGTKLKAYLHNQELSSGVLGLYFQDINTRTEKLKEEKEDTIEDLDTKYDFMAQQFIEYASVISQMEASFSSLKMLIENPPKD